MSEMECLHKEKIMRSELYREMQKSTPGLSYNAFTLRIHRLVKEGKLVKIGRDVYSPCENVRKIYNHEYSATAEKAAALLISQFPGTDFRIFELTQLNDFLNHLIARNYLFISTVGESSDFIFDPMRNLFPGNVMLRPDKENYFRYRTDDTIILQKLPTETPKGRKQFWHTDLEKMLVDVFVDPLIRGSFSENEIPMIYEDSFSEYILDKDRLSRYARRRGAERKLREYISKETEISLRRE